MTATDLLDHIRTYHRASGRLPRLRDLVEHFDGKVLNVLMALGEIDKATADKLRAVAREERKAAKQ